MKSYLLKSSLAIMIISTLTSCIATHMGSMSGSASLEAPNFIYKKQNIYGQAQATYVLGIGGVARQSLIYEAKKNMLKENPLYKNQALANVTYSYKTTGFLYFIVTTVECTVSADIVEFDSPQTELSQTQKQSSSPELPRNENQMTENNPDKKNIEKTIDPIIKVGDKVNIIYYFSSPVEGKVIDIIDGNYVIEYQKSNNKSRQVKVSEFQVEKIK